MSRALDVWFNENKAGRLMQNNSGQLEFTYYPEYLNSKQPWPLSVSLKLQKESFKDRITRPFFSGFLPDDMMRKRLAQKLKVSEKNPFALLEIVGGECAGAVSLYPEGKQPHREDPEDIQLLEEPDLDEVIKLLRRHPLLAGEKNVRLSLAGAQDKVGVRLIENKIALMRGGAPTTHILKPLITDRNSITDSIHNEFFCLQLAQEVGIPAPRAEIRFASREPFLLIERYDRILENEKIIRLHQEDFCQALSIPPENKYEREGGPGIKSCLDVIQDYSIQPIPDQIKFLKIIIFNYLIGNNDAHGKNFSFLHQQGKVSLAPVYDLLSTVVYPDLDPKMAMKIGGKYKPEEIYLRHWLRLVSDTAAARKTLRKELEDMPELTLKQAERLKNELKTSGSNSPIFDAILTIIKTRAERILSLKE